jgi:apolipoprotein D and lipocalin family protein
MLSWFRSRGLSVVKQFRVCRASVLAVVLAAGPCAAAVASPPPSPEGAPQLAQPLPRLDYQRLAGRWYEVARVPNKAEDDCPVATTDWQPLPGGKYRVTQTCSKAMDGPPGRVIHATADPLEPATNAKWRMNYFGGLIRRDYWVVDRAPDDQWLILAMPGKRFVWVLARQPFTPQVQREQFVQKIAALGYDASRLVFPVTLAERGD